MIRNAFFLLTVSMLLNQGSINSQEIGFVEKFALAEDRGKVLSQLVPGTEDYYYYSALYHQSLGEFDKVDDILTKWIEDHKESARVKIIQNRQALLRFSTDPTSTFEFIQTRLNLNFHHQREIPTAERNLPSALDQKRISREVLTKLALSRHGDLSGFTSTGLEHVAKLTLTKKQRRHLLDRLVFPDYPQLVELYVEYLQDPKRGFGDLKVHRNFTIDQMESCLDVVPRLINDSGFVNSYLLKLRPSDDVNWRSSDKEYRAYLDRLYQFAQRLNPVFNSLKAGILFRILELDRKQGSYNRDLFFEYIKLPRDIHYVNRDIIPTDRRKQSHIARLSANFEQWTGFQAIQNDYELVYDYLDHFLVNARNYDSFAPYIKDGVLDDIFATVKLLNGKGDKERWAARLTRTQFQELKDRVDLDFAPTNRQFYTDDKMVSVELNTKNVDSLIVKVYEINELNYYRKYKREIDTDISLDGLVPNSEASYSYEDDPLLRKSRKFEFEQLSQNGVYIIDFIGGGESSRALVRRGRLSTIGKTTVAGQLYHVFDHNNRAVKNAEIWIAGNRYVADKNGVIAVPFSNQPGQQIAIISAANFSSIQTIQQQEESYVFDAGIYIDRESLLFNQMAQVLIRPSIKIAGQPASVAVLDDASLTITSVNQSGISSTKQIDGLELKDDLETICDFVVPPRLKSITFRLDCKIENISRNQEQTLRIDRTFNVNQIDSSDEIQDVHLLPTNNGFALEVRGRTGEIRRAQAARIALQHRDFKDPIYADLESDDKGQIFLGKLEGIVNIAATIAGGSKRSWPIHQNTSVSLDKINVVVDEPVTIAAPRGLTEISRDQISLFEQRAGQIVADHFEKVRLEERKIVLSDLGPGDYLLRFKKSEQTIYVSVAAGVKEFGVVLGKHRRSELRDLSPLVIENVESNDDGLRVKIGNANKLTRVHVIASRFQPRFNSFSELYKIRDITPWSQDISIRQSVYMAGRTLSDEYQYILNRRYEKKYPGNMLTQPSMLINPWSNRDTQNNVESLAEGDEFGNVGNDADSLAQRTKKGSAAGGSTTDFANLDFLRNPSVMIANQKPDANGILKVSKDQLNGLQYIRIIGIDPISSVQHDVSIAPTEIELKDLRLANGLDPDAHFAQSKQVEILNRGDLLTIEDMVSGRFHYFDDIGDVFRLFLALNPNTKLNEFQFLLNWSGKSLQQKQALYSKHACHELNFYLYKKDKAFFDDVIKRHVSFKTEQGFVDQFLAQHPLQRFIDEQWSYDKLNVFERILLAQKSENHAADIIRNIEDSYYLKPVKREYFDALYDRSIRSGELDFETSFGGRENLKRKGLPGLSENAPPPVQLPASENEAVRSDGFLAVPGGGGGGGHGGRGGIGRGRTAKRENDTRKLRAGFSLEAEDKLAEARQSIRLGQKPASTREEQFGYSINAAGKERSPAEAKYLGEFGDFAVDALYFEKNNQLTELRRKGKSLYRRLPQTKEWIEQQYYQLPLKNQRPDLVQANRFWMDYSKHTGGSFLSQHFSEAHRTLTEMMFALAILDLPEKAPEHQFDYVGNSMKLTAGGNMIAMHQQFRPVLNIPRNTAVLISENFFQKNDRYRQVDGVQFDKFVSEQFYAHTLYGAQVVVTNPTSTPQAIDLLIQIPEGGVATSGSQETRSMQMQLSAFSTKTFEYFFYFPTAGEFTHYPAHVSREDEVLAVADSISFNVIDQPVDIDKSSWAYVSQNGSEDDVIEFLRTKNVLRLALEKIAFRMKDQQYFRRVINTLKSRYHYNHRLWSYAVKHRDQVATKEFLMHESQINQHLGKYFSSELLTIQPYARNWYQHKEYSPLINARAHKLSINRKILNPVFHSQYHQLLEVLANRNSLTSEDQLVVTYYMLLQGRIEEAISHFGKIDKADLNEQIQFDYCDAYLDFYLEDPQSAAETARKWSDYPVDLWRNRFQNILAQVEEIRGAEVAVTDNRDDTQQQTKAASETASFDFEVEAKQVRISAQAVSGLQINYYEMDIEHMFSNSPFELKNLDRFSVIKPTVSNEIMDKGSFEKTIDIPEKFANRNVLVEIRGGDQVKAKPYFANSMAVQTIERFGQLKVSHLDTKRPVTKAYVKVYSQQVNGQIKFHKDGYTDLRGRFDYVSQSNNPLDGIAKYSILVLSPEHGAITRQVNPPAE